MGYELLRYFCGILEQAGLEVSEEYPGADHPEVDRPRAAVGLRGPDLRAGTVGFAVRILCPRVMGGWFCQSWALMAALALEGAGIACKSGEPEYLSGCDCFCVTVTAQMPASLTDGQWTPGSRWEIACGEEVQEHVVSFRAVRDQGRRLLYAHTSSDSVAVTPGGGGWVLELVQDPAAPVQPEEPFVLTVRGADGIHRYTGCCWNETVWEYTQEGGRLTRRGFALAREEE